jgi:hypothetical protein
MKSFKASEIELRSIIESWNPTKLPLSQSLWILSVLLIILGFTQIFMLPLSASMILVFVGMGLTPWFIRYQLKWMNEERDFFMLTDFLQQLVATFKQHPKIYASLVECKDITQGRLRSDVTQWLNELEAGGFPAEHAQRFITAWPHFIVGNLVHLMIAVESFGTFNYAEGLEIIQDDIEDWIEDTYLFKQQQLSTRNRIQLLILFSLGIAFMCHNMLFKTDMIQELTFYHLSLFTFLLMDLLTLFFSQKSISGSWIEAREMIWKKESH